MIRIRYFFVALAFAAVVAAFACSTASGQAKVINARVIDVEDGNTILIKDFRNEEHKLRLKCIESPGLSEPFGSGAREYLSRLVGGKWVRVVATRYDRQGRFIGKVLLKGRDISLEMVIAGFAKHYWGFGHDQTPQDRALFEAAEKNAMRSKFNIWSSG
jgi:endonuclease YncB( thermonuclease family)